MKDIKDYIDSFGMIVTKQQDGGDSCSHGCAVMYAYSAVGDVNVGSPVNRTRYLTLLEKDIGRYVRHPDHNKWYSDLDRFSRDQMTPLLCLLGLIKHKRRLNNLFNSHLKHLLLFAWNFRKNFVYKTPEEHKLKSTPDVPWDYKKKLPDATGPEVWATWIRSFRAYPLYPLLLLFDLENLVGSIKHRYFTSTDIQMNHILMTDFATRIMPTPVSLLSQHVYGKKVAIWALNNKWGNLIDEPPINQYLVPLVESWKVRN